MFDKGDKVRTIEPEVEPSGYSPGARDGNRWGVEGVVEHRSDAHGLCYRVRHEDGTTGWYEHAELLSVNNFWKHIRES